MNTYKKIQAAMLENEHWYLAHVRRNPPYSAASPSVSGYNALERLEKKGLIWYDKKAHRDVLTPKGENYFRRHKKEIAAVYDL